MRLRGFAIRRLQNVSRTAEDWSDIQQTNRMFTFLTSSLVIASAAGHSVVASGRDRDRVSRALGTSSDVLGVTLDVTSAADAATHLKGEYFKR